MYECVCQMPLLKRVIHPTHVSRVPLVQEWVKDETGRVFPAMLPATDPPQDLDAFTNLTLANLITQVCSMSRGVLSVVRCVVCREVCSMSLGVL